MAKVKLSLLSKEQGFHVLAVEKSHTFFEWMEDFLHRSFGVLDAGKYGTEEGGKGVLKEKNIEDFTDRYESFESKDTRIHVFYGKDNVFMLIQIPQSKREKFVKILEETTEWSKSDHAED